MADSSGLDHSNLQAQAVALTISFPILATIGVGLRLYSRFLTRTFGLDDWTICVAAIFYWAETFVAYSFIKVGYIGYHIYDIPKTYNAPLAAKYLYAVELIYAPILGLIKISIMLFLLSLTGQKQAIRRAILALLIVNGVASILNVFLIMFQCLPIPALWDKEAFPDAKCLDFTMVTTAFASISVITDGFALILPTWIVYDLKIKKRQKLMLIGILSVGFITVVAGLVRLVLLQQYDSSKPKDPTHTILFCISNIEIGLAFVAACAPYMKPLVVKFAPKIFSTSRHGKSSQKYSRTGYELGEGSWRGTPQTKTQINVSGNFDARAIKDDGLKGPHDIVMVTETDVTWQDRADLSVKSQTSTNSLV